MIRALENIRHNGVDYKAGDLIEGLSAEDRERLIELNSAVPVVTTEEELQIQTVEAEKVPKYTAEEFNQIAEAISENYNVDELKRLAKELKVNLAGATKKPAIIEAIIIQGKADELLEDDVDGEENE